LTCNDTEKFAILLLGSQMTTAGAQRILLMQARWLYERGYPVMAAFFYDRDGLREQWQSENSFSIISLDAWERYGGVRDGVRLLRGLGRLYQILRAEKICVVETFTHHANLLGLPVAWAARVPVRVANHRGRIDGLPKWMERLHSWMVNLGIATDLVAVSRGVYRQAIDEEGIDPSKITLIQNGIDNSEPRTDLSMTRNTLAHEIGVAPEGCIVLTVGRLEEQKGHTYLLDAIPSVLERFPQTTFAFAGEGSLRTKLENKTREMGIEHAVRFLGNRTDVHDLLRFSDVFVLPSLWEGLSNALLEAMAAGLPVVATRVEGTEEVIEDGINGLLVPPADPQALSQAILRFLSEDRLRIQIGQAGEKHVKENYTLEKMCGRYESLFKAHFNTLTK
jgi:glycosyltransferase involved in cell wall biosynthesis